MIQRPNLEVHWINRTGWTYKMGIAHGTMTGAVRGAKRDRHSVNFPDHPMVMRLRLPAGDVHELARLRHTRIMNQQAVRHGDRSLGSPLAANLAGLGVVPSAAQLPIIDINQVIPVLA